MKIIEILQRADIESQYNESNPDTGIFSSEDYTIVQMNLNNAWERLEESFSEEQIELYERCYLPVEQIYNELVKKIEFERGFKMAMHIMCDGLG